VQGFRSRRAHRRKPDVSHRSGSFTIASVTKWKGVATSVKYSRDFRNLAPRKKRPSLAERPQRHAQTRLGTYRCILFLNLKSDINANAPRAFVKQLFAWTAQIKTNLVLGSGIPAVFFETKRRSNACLTKCLSSRDSMTRGLGERCRIAPARIWSGITNKSLL